MNSEWSLILVNNDNPVPAGYKVITAKLPGGKEMDCRAAPCAIKMLKKARCECVDIAICSAYRSVEYQQKLFDADIKSYMEQGLSYDEAYARTAEFLALPGRSEHNIGLALDLCTDENEELTEEFENTEAFRWLDRNAACFGFILRYPKDKESVTKIGYEPWHYRYVGRKYAKIIKKYGLTLEEYVKLK